MIRARTSYPMGRSLGEEDLDLWRLLHNVQFSAEISDEHAKYDANFAPTCIGNVIVGQGQEFLIKRRFDSASYNSTFVLVVEHLTILQLQTCIVFALVQIHNKLDRDTLIAFKELVNAVLVVALIELAIGLESWLWGFGHLDKVHENDRAHYEPKDHSSPPGCLLRFGSFLRRTAR